MFSQAGRDEQARVVQRLGVLGEDASDCTVAEPDLVGNADKRAPEGFALLVARQALGRLGQRVEKRAATGAAAVPLADDAQGDLLPGYRQIQEQRLLCAESLELAANATVEAGGGRSLEGDLSW